MSEPRVGRITIYPIKSLDGVDVSEARLTTTGALAGDRRFAFFDREGRYFNGKRDARIHEVRTTFESDLSAMTVEAPGGQRQTFSLSDPLRLNEWFSEYFGLGLALRENVDGGFPDDQDCPGPTVTSWATLRAVGRWVSDAGLSDDELHRRFRANIVLDDCEPFYEDSLYGDPGGTAFFIGSVRFLGVRPSARCAVPARDSRSGTTLVNFQKRFVDNRKVELPPGVNRSAFDHYYRLCVNTRVPNAGPEQVIRRGDPVRSEFSFDFEW